MSWLALLLLGVGVADLLAAARPGLRWVPGLLGAALSVTAGLLAGFVGPDLAALAVIAATVVAWDAVAGTAESTPVRARRTLAVLALPAVALVALSGFASPVAGALGAWLTWMQVPAISGRGAGGILMIAALAVANTATGNRLVRLVLVSIHAQPPRLDGREGVAPASERLRGGRLLGPMERLLILGFGAAGYVEAAAVVVAAKGLLRFPELQAAARSEPRAVDEVTEYFLVGTFTSLLVALGSVVLLA
ncbi:hypothetical protein G7070_12005 [Propioniciclava coleopterorum]|uniref:Uncharacterized protein n=1 Tax=Propioniciclava coleopterorum TaxID=2714937 RepID=A0A6G7Y8A3_9ACTN|nr:hypothetical protein [Propioniciclava coleopterorum]QIK72861.1 hypothetical protein G7070_12005 [Propioniciclava coleopterorum]